MGREIFVSFSSSDQKIADELVAALEKRGYRCWISHRNVPAGANYMEAIPAAIQHARIMLFLYSANSHKSDQVKKEIAIAGQSGLTIIPLKLEDITPTGAFLYEFSTRQWIDFFGDRDAALEILLEQLRKFLSGDAPAPVVIRPNAGKRREFSRPPKPTNYALIFAVMALVVIAALAANDYTGDNSRLKRIIERVSSSSESRAPQLPAGENKKPADQTRLRTKPAASPLPVSQANEKKPEIIAPAPAPAQMTVVDPESFQGPDGLAEKCGAESVTARILFDGNNLPPAPDGVFKRIYDKADSQVYVTVTAYGIAGETAEQMQQRAIKTMQRLQKIAAADGKTLHFILKTRASPLVAANPDQRWAEIEACRP